MKIVKLTPELFYFETDEHEGRIIDWAGLLTILDDIAPHSDTDIGELITELASYGNGATRRL